MLGNDFREEIEKREFGFRDLYDAAADDESGEEEKNPMDELITIGG